MPSNAVRYLPYAIRNIKKNPNPNLKTSRFDFPKAIMGRYNTYLTEFCLALFAATEQYLITGMDDLVFQSDMTKPMPVVTDTWVADLEGDINDIYNAVPLDEWADPDTLKSFVYDTNKFSAEKFAEVTRAYYGVDIFTTETWLTTVSQAFASQNATLIKSLKDTYLKDVSVIANNAIQSGQRSEEIAQLIRDRYGVTQSRADLIAQDQIGKLNGQINMYRQQSAGFNSYTWQTSEDERVRESHEELNGQVISWDDPPPDTGHPGQDYRCRCTAIPYFPDNADLEMGFSNEEHPYDD